jgi:DNA-binding response OmpR family regulator
MKILVIDDDATNVEILNEMLTDEGYETIESTCPLLGWDLLEKNSDIDVLLLDLMMPNFDGIEFLQKMKSNEILKNIPVIMQTAAADDQSVIDGINAGVYYYITKPFERDVLLSIVRAAYNDFKLAKSTIDNLQKTEEVFNLIDHASFRFKNLDQAKKLGYYIANSFPKPERVVYGLLEILINAIEHGNLGITYAEKGQLLMEDKLLEEINRRENLPQNIGKTAEILLERNKDYVRVVVKDQGQGFNWKDYMEVDPSRVTAPNGRGILIAKSLSFDKIMYMGNGNEVHCTCYSEGMKELYHMKQG